MGKFPIKQFHCFFCMAAKKQKNVSWKSSFRTIPWYAYAYKNYYYHHYHYRHELHDENYPRNNKKIIFSYYSEFFSFFSKFIPLFVGQKIWLCLGCIFSKHSNNNKTKTSIMLNDDEEKCFPMQIKLMTTTTTKMTMIIKQQRQTLMKSFDQLI